MAKHRAYRTSGGFTLVEAIIVMVVMSIAALGIATMSGHIFDAETSNKTLEIGDQLMQGCAEQLLAKRRGPNGYADSNLSITTNNSDLCTAITAGTYSSPIVTISDGTGMPACPYSTGSNCKLVAVTQGGIRPITFMLVN